MSPLLYVIGILVAFLQALILWLLADLRHDIRASFTRINKVENELRNHIADHARGAFHLKAGPVQV